MARIVYFAEEPRRSGAPRERLLSTILDALNSHQPVCAAELRPPRAELQGHEGMDAWIDTYHAVRRLTREGTHVFLTDSAVGTPEEDNVRHLTTNLGPDAPRARVVPFLTSKHPIEYCLSYADRAWHENFPALVVLGGDRTVGTPRCVEHAWQLRRAIRERQPGLVLGGWANPHADAAWQADLVGAPEFAAEFFLTQIVSHHHARQVERLVKELERRGVRTPGVFGIFFYRSAKPGTLAMLREFLPVPVEALTAEFAAGATPVEVCARSVRTLRSAGVRHFYVSNLPLDRASETLREILRLAHG
jgi:5,10-methylenetetrahydrofolate reductase